MRGCMDWSSLLVLTANAQMLALVGKLALPIPQTQKRVTTNAQCYHDINIMDFCQKYTQLIHRYVLVNHFCHLCKNICLSACLQNCLQNCLQMCAVLVCATCAFFLPFCKTVFKGVLVVCEAATHTLTDSSSSVEPTKTSRKRGGNI